MIDQEFGVRVVRIYIIIKPEKKKIMNKKGVVTKYS